MNEEVEKILYQLNRDIKGNSNIYIDNDNSIIKSDEYIATFIGSFYEDHLHFPNFYHINYTNKKTETLKNQVISNYNFFTCLAGKSETFFSRDNFTIWNCFNNKVFTLIYKATIVNHRLMLYPHVVIRDSSHINLKNKITKLAFDTKNSFENKDYIIFEKTIYDSTDSFKDLNEALFNIYIKPSLKIDISEFNKEWFSLLNMINLK